MDGGERDGGEWDGMTVEEVEGGNGASVFLSRHRKHGEGCHFCLSKEQGGDDTMFFTLVVALGWRFFCGFGPWLFFPSLCLASNIQLRPSTRASVQQL